MLLIGDTTPVGRVGEERPSRVTYAMGMFEFGSRARTLPAPPIVVFESLVDPHRPRCRPWLVLLSDESEPDVLEVERPRLVVWSSLWPSRPDDQVHLRLTGVAGGTSLRFTLLTPGEPPDASKTGHMRKRMNQLLFSDLRLSYGQ